MLLHQIARKQITDFATEQGFHSVGFVPSQDATRFDAFCSWLDRGFSASMSYLQNRKEAYRNPHSVLPNCQTVIVLTLPYQGHPWTHSVIKKNQQRYLPDHKQSTIGSYASAKEDYHHWIRRKLKPLVREMQRMFPNCQSRAVVDTTPLLERDFAEQSGLGWIGKNTMLLNRRIGSYFFLCEILTQAKLSDPLEDHDKVSSRSNLSPLRTSHCGKCTACLDACPTEAFPEPYVLDANKCISYWTIEHRGPIPESIRASLGPWLFGCDVCQIVCPWNRKAQAVVSPEVEPDGLQRKSDCIHWLTIVEEEFDELYRDTPFWRTGFLGMKRNALLVAVNLKLTQAIPHIARLANDPDTDIKQLALWALEMSKQFPTGIG